MIVRTLVSIVVGINVTEPQETRRQDDATVATAAETLLEKASQLSASDRALLASDLLASLDDEAAVDESWSRETDRRARMFDKGEAQLVTWDHLAERIAGERPSASQG